VPPERLRDILTVALFAVSPFVRLQAVFDATVSIVGDLFGEKEIRSVEVKAGQAIIFTSLNMHASHDNVTADDSRLSFVGRYVPGTVGVYQGMTHDVVSAYNGVLAFPIDRVGCIQAHGEHTAGLNRIASRPS